MDFPHPNISKVTLIGGVRQEVFSPRNLTYFEKGQVTPIYHFHFQDVDPFFLFVVMVAHRHQTITQRLEITGATRLVKDQLT